MKTKLMVNIRLRLTLSFLLGLLALAFVFRNSEHSNVQLIPASPPPPANNNITDNFLFGSLQSAADDGNGFANVNELGLNMWHVYLGGKQDPNNQNRHIPTGWDGVNGLDQLEAPLSQYDTVVKGKLNTLHGNNNMRALMQRPKIEYLCLGQRSDYQCEDIANVDVKTFFYSFQSPGSEGTDIEDNSAFGNGQWVKQCIVNNNQTDGGAGWVVRGLRANTEQCRPTEGENQWAQDGEHTWYIKPSIRIDSDFANNPANFNTPVCRIEVINEEGNSFKEVILRARHFLVDTLGTYNGRYLEEFTYGNDTARLMHYGAWGTKWQWQARGDRPENELENKTDIQVYWYGNCDMWIDYVRVDNGIAHDLLSNDPLNPNWVQYENWLGWEASLANYNTSPLKFYIELIEFNNIPCIAYVNRRLDSLTTYGVDMMVDITLQYGVHCNWDDVDQVYNAEHIANYYIEKVNAKQIFMESYPFTSTFTDPNTVVTYSRIPNTLNPTGIVLAQTTNSSGYDQWLQENLDASPYVFEPGYTGDKPEGGGGTDCQTTDNYPSQDKGNFRFIMKTGREVSRIANIPFIYMQQAHQWYKSEEVRREPTVEEMSMLSNVAVSYGVKGIIYYWFPGHSSDPDCDYSYGLIEHGTNTPRNENVYGQPKWDSLKRTIERIKKWDPFLMSFDNRYISSYIYSLERTNFLSQTYFKDIAAYKKPFGPPVTCQTGDSPDTTDASPPPNLRADCYEDTYLQAATFKKSTDDGNKYFMIVNRRCSPYVDETTEDNYGGKRFIRAFFDRDLNSRYTLWNVIDLGSNSNVGTVNIKSVNPYIDLGSFAPGEGRLYKIVQK